MSQRFVKIQDHEELIRDNNSSAVLNVDNQALEQYKARRKKQREKNEEIENLKQDVSEIKSLLYKLLEKEGGK